MMAQKGAIKQKAETPTSTTAFMGHFSSLIGFFFPTYICCVPEFRLNGPFSLLEIPCKKVVKKRGTKRFLIFALRIFWGYF